MKIENKVYRNREARKKLIDGINLLADAVGSTLGPKGRNAVLDDQYGSPIITNDGVSIARKINIEDSAMNIGCRIIKQAAEKVNNEAGDGTTTTTVIAQSLINNGSFLVDEGGDDPLAIKRQLDDSLPIIREFLSSISKKITDKKEAIDVATISVESKKLGKLIANAIYDVGEHGVVTAEISPFYETTTDIVEGYRFYRGYLSPYMITNIETMEAELNEPYIILTDKKINEFSEIQPSIEACLANKIKDILIICLDASDEVIATSLTNNIKGITKIIIVKSPSQGRKVEELLKDISIVTGGTVISENNGLSLRKIVNTDNFGRAKKVIINEDSTTIIEGSGSLDLVNKRIKELETLYESKKTTVEGEEIRQRIGKLSGKVAVIKVGGTTEVEQIALKHKIDDALSATNVAIKEGIVPGGGLALLKCSDYLEKNLPDSPGKSLLVEALKAPFEKICSNAGIDSEEAIEKINSLPDNYGLDTLTGEYKDLLKEGIVDPLKVSIVVVEAAVSVAGILLTTNTLVVDNKIKDNDTIR